ncbi:non-homologous end-joining DNA ligase [uncultured Enterovirga sp.]|uniref:non-homologous end-joining DNA ligase n=1 Tax=uncultured Enterovirga sp. TaxID=2026352 RepID=UPI0035CB7116
MSAGEAIEVEGVRLTSPDKILYTEQGITKRELASYYVAVADRMVPYVANRPITLVRCPAGRQKKCFYQRHAGSGVPSELGQVEVAGFEESGAYLFIRDVRGLVALVQMGVLEIHPWNAHVDRTDRPDQVIFDLDPGEGLAFQNVAAAAHDVRAELDRLGLPGFLKTTGGKGLHIVVPITPDHDWAEVKRFSKAVGDKLSAAEPERFLTRQSIAARKGRIFIDYLRNDPTSTAVAPFSTRSRPGATVSVPIGWSELTPDLDPAELTLRTVPNWLARRTDDPWAGMDAARRPLPPL